MKGAILFCGYRLIQRTWLLAFSHSAQLPFGFYAPLLRFCSLQCLRYQEPVVPRFSLPGIVRSCAFSSLQRFALPGTFRVYFTPKHSWDFPYRAFSFKRLVSSSWTISRRSKTLTLVPLVASRTGCVMAVLSRVIITALQIGFKVLFPLKARSHQFRD
jgi:hypothetical protein